jgi:hypothetical protein
MTLRRLLRPLLFYIAAALLFAAITVGLLNTYLGVDSPVRPVVQTAVSLLHPMLPFIEGLRDRKQGEPVARAAVQPRQNAVVGVGGAAWHQPIDDTSFLCGAPDVSTVEVWSQRTAYTWVNEDGVRSFGDEAPSDLSAHRLDLDEGDRDFEIHVTWEHVNPNPALEGPLRGGAMRIHEQWGEWIGRDRLVRSQVTLRITGDRNRFLRDWGGDANGPIPSGFYSLARKEAVAFYGGPEHTLCIA